MSIAYARTFSLAFVGAVLISSCAPACLPPATPEVAETTTIPAPTTTIQQQGQLTVTYDGAGPNVAGSG